ncbi:MAG: 3-phosphoshikimate 1-carboxyvinyltransferase [Lachnospiraceae bacterium]|nr:3-phosphoshikimate 1-carboxyvinyltransferase [Lachnospiraceae bacterium]
MNIQIKKINKLHGDLIARPSKSFAHRYLIAAALSNDESVISNVDFSNDIIATLNCIHAYGKKHYREFEKHEVHFSNECTKNFDPTFDCKESGTTIRIFMPIALRKYDKATFIGSDRLIERGIDIYENIFKYVTFYKDKYSIKTKGTINAGHFELPGNISSQYISGLLYALPLLDGDSEIVITTELESTNYILMTLEVLKNYGIQIETNLNRMGEFHEPVYFKIKGNQKYSAHNFSIEGDYSNAAFIDAFNYFGNAINLTGLNPNSLQSDIIYKKYFDILNKDFSEIDISNCIDLGPILITFAALKNGAKFTGTSRLKIKESDRGNVIAEELKKCGADISVLDNEIIVNKKELHSSTTPFDSHNDHRIAMALSLLSTQFDIEIAGSECVSKSYPGYFDDLKSLGATVI